MSMRKIELEIRSTSENGKWMAAAIVNGEVKPAHLMESSEHCFGGLRTVGGNHARYFRPDDELWWLSFFEGKESVRITGELCEAK